MKQKIKYAGYLLSALSLFFVFKVLLKSDFSSLDFLHRPHSLLRLAAGFASYWLLLVMTAWSWKLSLDFLSKGKSEWGQVFGIFAKCNVAKYLPGNVMHYVGRQFFAMELGLSQLEVTLSSLVEIASAIGSAVLLVVLFAPDNLHMLMAPETQERLPALALLLVATALILGLLFFALNKRFQFLRPYTAKLEALFVIVKDKKFWGLWGRVVGIFAIQHLILGWILYLVFESVLPGHNQAGVTPIILASVVSWAAGFLVPSAPGGVGIREFVLISLLSSSYQPGELALVAVVSRLLSILGDASAAIFSYFWIKPRLVLQTGKERSLE